MSGKGGGLAASKVEEFRVVLRGASLDNCTTTADILMDLLENRAVYDQVRKVAVLDVRAFIDGMSSMREMRHKFTTADLADIFSEADEGELGNMTLNDLIDFVDKTVSRARTLALKLRSAVLKQFKFEADYREAFASMCNITTKEIEKESFTQFAEDILQQSITESDALALYSLFDSDENGKISLDDFVGFISGQSTEALNILATGDPEDIVDLRISADAQTDSEYLRLGYTQIIPRLQNGMKYDVGTQGSFGKGESIWVWRRKQGTCSGRLRPIVDVQLTSKDPSSAMVVNGYSNLRGSINGKRCWIRRAQSSAEFDEALVDLTVTIGKPSNAADQIWVAPGPGWVRVDSNFAASVFSYTDAFLWMLPIRTRTTELGDINAMTRAAVAMSDAKRKEAILTQCRLGIRNLVPYSEIKTECRPSIFRRATGNQSTADQITATARPMHDSGAVKSFDSSVDSMNTMVTKSVKKYDFSTTFLEYQNSRGQLTQSQLGYMLKHAGCHLESEMVAYVFRQFDVAGKAYLTREDFAKSVTLTGYELDHRVELIRKKMASRGKTSASMGDVTHYTASESMKAHIKATRGVHSTVRTSKLFAQVFHLVNTDRDGIMSLIEFQEMMSALEVYVTDSESRKIMKAMDMTGNDRVEEVDFVRFMKKQNEMTSKLAHRLRDEAGEFRRWLQRGGSGSRVSSSSEESTGYANAAQWAELMARHSLNAQDRGSNSLDPDDIMSIMGYLGLPVTSKSSRAMMLLISPDGNGRCSQAALQSFMDRTSRTFGELLALMERDVMKPVYDSFVAYQEAKLCGGRDVDKLEMAYRAFVREIVTEVQNSSVPGAQQSPRATEVQTSSGSQEVVSIGQLKGGLEAAVRRYKEIDGTAPNVEEWACLSVLVGAFVADDGVFGVHPHLFVDSLCSLMLTGPKLQAMVSSTASSMTSVDRLTKEMQRLIRETALGAGNGVKYDYRAAFDAINTDGDEVLSVKELKAHLSRLHLSDLCPDEDLPNFVRTIDKSNRGYITFDDFMKFVEDYKNVADFTEASRAEEDAADETDPAKMSGNPPVAITKNGECDYLLWFVWRQCCRIEPTDPEIIVTELESACTETELSQVHGTISVKELWNLMFELKIQTQNNISKTQFEKGIRYLVNDPRDLVLASGKNVDSYDVQVDYRALTRYVVRMGRAHEALVEEKKASDDAKFHQLKADLKRYLRTLDQEGAVTTGYTPRDADSPSQSAQLRFERVFKRLDSDGDGKITIIEFKVGLRRLGYKQEKSWTTSIVKILFRELDSDQDGTLSLIELSRLVQDDNGDTSPRSLGGARDRADSRRSSPESTGNGFDDATDPDDEVFGKQAMRNMGEHELFYKVYSILKEMVPSTSGGGHFDPIKNAVRKFFLRSDVDNRGWVSEERFRAFLRRSSIADKMTSGELRRITETLIKKHVVRSSGGASSTQSVVDYERLIVLMEAASTAGPGAKSDLVLLKLRDAAITSSQAGRPFLSLCSLVDSTNCGRISKDELQLTAKMMGCTVSGADLESLKDDVLEGTFGADGSVDYKEINYLLTKEGPVGGGMTGGKGVAPLLGLGPASFSRPQAHSHTIGAHAHAATHGMHGHGADGGAGVGTGEYLTPRGNLYDRLAATTPHMGGGGYGARAAPGTVGGGGGASPYMSPGPYRGGGAGGDSELSHLLDKVRGAVDDKSRKWAGRGAYTGSAQDSYSLLRQMQMFDLSHTRSVDMRDCVAILEDLGLPLTHTDIRLLQTHYRGGGHEGVAYEAFCRDVEGGSGGRGGGGVAPGTAPRGGSFAPGYMQAARTKERFADLKAEGRNPRDMFEAYDLDVTGAVDTWRFKEVLHRLNLVLPEFVNEAVIDFAGLGGGDMVSYDDFCTVLETEAASHHYNGHHPATSMDGGRGGARDVRSASAPYTAGRDREPESAARGEMWRGGDEKDPLSNGNVDRWLHHPSGASPKQRREFEQIYDDLNRFKEDQRSSSAVRNHSRDGPLSRSRDRDFPLALDEGTEYDSGSGSNRLRLRPPAVGSSYDFDSDRGRGMGSRTPLSSSRNFDNARGSFEGTRASLERERSGGSTGRYRSESPKPPRASPSKVGSKMWGSHTSLDLKGKSITIDAGHWCCPVCLYVENDTQSDKCLICNTPNYNNRPDFQVKEQCTNCTFLNGQYASECEMCGLGLGSNSSSKSVF